MKQESSKKRRRQRPLSLNQSATPEGNFEFQDFLTSDDDLEKNLYLEELKAQFEEITTSPKYRAIYPGKKTHCNLAVFVQFQLEDKTFKEIAQELGISKGYSGSLWYKKFVPILQEILKDFK